MFKCINSANEVRTFDTYDEALRFVLREGDASRLWSIEGELARVMRDRRAAQ